ncbi:MULTISPECIES: hypothetical protein [Bradyrhizobium]|uniref:Uncharacterized protein n=1 Tax=Bradyrhizobium daqingense TaxID=993502 RepID=A0A562KFN8_9BRAD|nr:MULTISPECIES: hypothetical protein [Bradyrhizobium]AJA65519.1 hypothetical protein RN69_38550 [Bradyrhizobium japonicum]KMJ93506.1 hypothetical protein CF64_42640 [Bradyrhizobium japonicum]MCS3537340.1 2-methylisocitrate lyase-like PEP mutase family enzyme [Bradyrhizobium japonicum]MCS3986571.1 2-methylisocitrate lyase-like PEP mutase family enzyme [Bradyrhizobium japonicum]MCS4018614.1 2-methylisocitrate lyase-like PEP mutase family enzyme [Bradyrhizobium japonicum]
MADIDTGYGNAINVIHAIGEYERTGASSVVIEDKTFPKVTSLAAERPDDELWQFRIRASSTALRDTFRRIIADGGVQNVHKDIVTIEELFRLQRMDEIEAAETRFLR